MGGDDRGGRDGPLTPAGTVEEEPHGPDPDPGGGVRGAEFAGGIRWQPLR